MTSGERMKVNKIQKQSTQGKASKIVYERGYLQLTSKAFCHSQLVVPK